MELTRNVGWVRSQRPIIHADGVYGHTITMNPWAIVEGDTIYLFCAGDDAPQRPLHRSEPRRRRPHPAVPL